MATEDQRLIARAVTGDADALAALLMAYYGRLLGYVKRRLPDDLADTIDPEDVVQEVHIEVFRSIAKFSTGESDSFFRWIATIAKQRTLDRIKAARRKKRGGSRHRIRKKPGALSASAGTLLDVVAQDKHTPSRSVARREGQRAVRIALAGLRKDYRKALELRYLEGLPVQTIAKRMDRTERSVHMLCNRGLKRLREAMGSASDFISVGGR